jgi:hypothetical protein
MHAFYQHGMLTHALFDFFYFDFVSEAAMPLIQAGDIFHPREFEVFLKLRQDYLLSHPLFSIQYDCCDLAAIYPITIIYQISKWLFYNEKTRRKQRVLVMTDLITEQSTAERQSLWMAALHCLLLQLVHW